MKKTVSIRKKLQEIFETEAFERLKAFKKEDKWEKLSLDDRELLGTLFVMQGEKLLRNGEQKKVKDNFSLACRIAPNNPRVYYRQALAFAGSEENTAMMRQACQALHSATKLNPGFFDAWFAWGVVLVKLGVFFQELSYLELAQDKFLQAESLLSATTSRRLGEFYHHYGNLYYQIGKISGEANDFSLACQKYRNAIEASGETVKFCCDIGAALCDLAYLINKSDLLFEGLEYYWKAVQKDPECSEGWVQLSYHLEKLFRSTSQESFFQMAIECFENAERLNVSGATLWLRWGHLLTFYGKSRKNIEAVDEACLKFEAADRIEPNHPKILSAWAEAKILIGTCDDSLEMLKEAEKMILSSIEMQPEVSSLWGLYGRCLAEIGRYFDDASYYQKSIEKYQFALSLNRGNHLLWHGLAQAQFSLGELKEDYRLVERACRLCVRVIEMGGKPYPQYWNDWGVVLLRLSQVTGKKEYLEAAIDKFERAIQLSKKNPDGEGADPEWLLSLGTALDIHGDMTDSQESHEKAVAILSNLDEQVPNYPNAQYALGLAKSHLAECAADVELFEQACLHFEEAAESEPDSDILLNEWGVAKIHWAELVKDPACEELYRSLLNQADRHLRQAIAAGSHVAVYNMAALQAIRGNYDVAIDCLERAHQLGSLPSLEDVLNDPWLESLFGRKEFTSFVNRIENHG